MKFCNGTWYLYIRQKRQISQNCKTNKPCFTKHISGVRTSTFVHWWVVLKFILIRLFNEKTSNLFIIKKIWQIIIILIISSTKWSNWILVHDWWLLEFCTCLNLANFLKVTVVGNIPKIRCVISFHESEILRMTISVLEEYTTLHFELINAQTKPKIIGNFFIEIIQWMSLLNIPDTSRSTLMDD